MGRRVAPGLAQKKDRWSSRDGARAFILASRTYLKYDPRVFEQTMRYDLQDLQDGAVGLMTPKPQDVALFMKPSPPLEGFPEVEVYASRTEDSNSKPGFYDAMCARVEAAMPSIQSQVFYI